LSALRRKPVAAARRLTFWMAGPLVRLKAKVVGEEA
jgi:hypothetical protein